MSDDLIRRSDAIKAIDGLPNAYNGWSDAYDKAYIIGTLEEVPTIEPNLILPERMERGECYEIGETIVVMNHDDYYDLLTRDEPKPGEWIGADDE